MNNAGASIERGSLRSGILGQNSLIHDSIEGLEAELRVEDDHGVRLSENRTVKNDVDNPALRVEETTRT